VTGRESRPRLLADTPQSEREAAAYEVLGRPAKVPEWRAALGVLRESNALDIELLLRSTLGRPAVELLLDVIALIAAQETPQALFALSVIERLRSEAIVQEAAREAAAALRPLSEAALEGGADGHATLYALLALPLQEQEHAAGRLDFSGADSPVRQAILDEDARLQRLSKERSYRSGSYLHYLRHRLADLVLITDIRGPLHDRAFRLLQQRVDDAPEQLDLLRAVPMDVRKRYVAWSLDPANASAEPRTVTALRLIRAREVPEADSRVLDQLVHSPSQGIAAEAARTALALQSRLPALRAAITRLIGELPEREAITLARDAVSADPTFLDFTELAPDRIAAVMGSGNGDAGLTAAAADALPSVDDPRALALTDALAATSQAAENVLRALVKRAAEGRAAALRHALADSRFRSAAWSRIRELPPARAEVLVRPLLGSEPPPRTAHLKQLLESKQIGDSSEALEPLLLRAAIEGAVGADELAHALPDERVRPAITAAIDARASASAEADAVEAALASGVRGRLSELKAELEPTITLARHRLGDSPALDRGLAALLAALDADARTSPDGPLAEAAPDAARSEPATLDPEPFREELRAVGVEVDGQRLIVQPEAASLEQRARYLATVDQRIDRPGSTESVRSAAAPLVREYIAALANAGEADAFLRALFEGGPLARAVIRLSPSTRAAVVEAAVDAGAEVDPRWFDHPVLGSWLRGLLQPQDEPELSEREQLERALQVAAAEESRRRRVLDATRRQLTVAKEAFAQQATEALAELDAVMDAYLELRRSLSTFGIEQVARLGSIIGRDDVDEERHEIASGEGAEEYVVRSPGVAVDGHVLTRARLEGVV
jgi:hypothetical protein